MTKFHSESRFSKRSSCSPAMAARKAIMRRMKLQALRQLQACLPSMANRAPRDQPDEVEVIMQTISFIDQLHATVLARYKAGQLSQQHAELINIAHIQQSLARSTFTRRQPSRPCQNQVQPIPFGHQTPNPTVSGQSRPVLNQVNRNSNIPTSQVPASRRRFVPKTWSLAE